MGDLSIGARSLLEPRGEARCSREEAEVLRAMVLASEGAVWVHFRVRDGTLNVSRKGSRIQDHKDKSESWCCLYTTEDTHLLKEVSSRENCAFQDLR